MEEKVTKQSEVEGKKLKNRRLLVFVFILIFIICTYINLRGTYLQYQELGNNYEEAFITNITYKYSIFAVNFILLYFLMYFTNRGIRKGLKEFFEKENRQMPKILNKSIAFVIAIIVSTLISNILMQKFLLCMSNTSFGAGAEDPIFGFNISYFVFQKPLIQALLFYFVGIIISITVYMTIYYIIVFNRYFDGIDGKMIKESLLMKKILRNINFIIIGIALITILNITDIVFNKMMTIKNEVDSTQNIEIIGAGYTEVMIQRWGYFIFAFVIIIAVKRAIKAFKNGEISKVLKNLLILPGYLVILFAIIVGFNLIFVNSDTLDKEKEYLSYNIVNTKKAYDIFIEEENVYNSGTITQEEVFINQEIINNIRIVNEETVLTSLGDNQTGTGYYSYRNANIAKYNIAGQNKLVYISPREMANVGRTYNYKTYEYTHGIGQIITSASEILETGNISYIQKNVSGIDDKLGTKTQSIYFGLETNDTVATNTKDKQEYDFTDEDGIEHTSTYKGEAGLKLNFIDRLILGIKMRDIKLAFSSEITKDSKILINRNIIERAKTALPYLIYDKKPYTVVTAEGKIVWVLDAYTVTSQYPYSQYTTIEHDNIKEKINYIRNSIKVIIDSYDGTMKFYVTDKTDPIAMAYRNTYPSIFENLDTKISEDISEHFIYPKYLYEVQAKLLKTYHNVKPDVLYRTDDIWEFAKYNNSIISKSTGKILEPYYTMIELDKESKIGLIQIYTPESKQNVISYLVGTTSGNENKLKLYKFSEDSNILGTMQLEKQIEQDETIWNEIQALNKTGTKITKDMIVVPIKNTLLYVESIYQTMLNESKVPVLKKVVVASGNKVAIGDNLTQALENLLSKDASDIEIDNTDDIDGLIEAIIKANRNLLESTNNKDWELIGTDIKKLQNLIENLEKLKNEENKRKDLEAINIENIISRDVNQNNT